MTKQTINQKGGIMRSMKSKLFYVVFILLFTVGSAQAVTLTPGSFTSLTGTTVAVEPQLAGTVIKDDIQPFSFAAYSGIVSGNVQVRIVRSDIDNTLDFYWRVFNDANSAGSIADLRLGSFISPEYNANYRTDGLGDVGPDRAWLFVNPPYNGYVNFNFSNGLAPGQSSFFFFLDTTATNYAQTADYDLTNMGQTQISQKYSTYAPASVPEPSTLLLIGSGLVGAGLLRRRFRS
jgi:hypothetical protein